MNMDDFSKLLSHRRKGASYFECDDRQVRDQDIAARLLVEMARNGVIHVRTRSIRPGPHKNRSPDVIAQTHEHGLVAIELTELVDEQYLREVNSGERDWIRAYTKEKLYDAISKCLRRKSSIQLCGGPYAWHILLIHTAELHLSPSPTFEWLENKTFDLSPLWNEAFLLMPPSVNREDEPPRECAYTKLRTT